MRLFQVSAKRSAGAPIEIIDRVRAKNRDDAIAEFSWQRRWSDYEFFFATEVAE